MSDEWREIEGFPAYWVSCDGKVKRMQPGTNAVVGHILKPWISASGRGYQMVELSRGPVRSKRTVHSLVCEAFRGPKPTPEHEVAHYDGDRLNNREENLSWKLPIENAADKERHGRQSRGNAHHLTKLKDEHLPLIRSAQGPRGLIRQLARQFGVSEALICLVRKGQYRNASIN